MAKKEVPATRRPIPKRFIRFTEEFPEVAYAYEGLGVAVHGSGPLSKRERALVKLGISVGARLEGGAHSHIRKALEAGASEDDLKQIALLAIPTIGFPPAMAAMSWIEDVIQDKPKKRRKKRS